MMISDSEFLEFLNDKSLDSSSVTNLKKIIDEELEKSEEEMDPDLIEFCLDALEKAKSEPEQSIKKTKRKKISKVLLIAAIIVISIGIAVPVGATVMRNGTSDKIVWFDTDHYNEDLRQGSKNANHYSNDGNDLIQELLKIGFDNVVLPSDLLNYNYSEDFDIQDGELHLLAVIKIEAPESKIRGYIGITQYDESVVPIIGTGQMDSKYTRVEQVSVNGLDIIVFCSANNEAVIDYIDNNTDYSIYLGNCDFDTAIKIAKSLE